MKLRHIKMTRDLHSSNVSVAGIVSLLYSNGVKGIRYMELRKDVQKEIQKIVHHV